MDGDPPMEKRELRTQLRRVLEFAYAIGHLPTGAWVKEQLVARVGDFDESELGYDSFLDLVRSFDDIADITQRPDSDFIVRLKDHSELFPDTILDVDNVPFVRPDLWNAFAFVRDENWVYDRAAGRAVQEDELDSHPSGLPDRFVEIPSLSASTLKGWMREFSEAWPDEDVADDLLEALDNDAGWLTAFNNELHNKNRRVQQAWRRKRALSVIQSIRGWATEHDVDLDHIVELDTPPSQQSSYQLPSSGQQRDTERERILSILQRAPLSELRKIRLPIGLVLDLDSE